MAGRQWTDEEIAALTRMYSDHLSASSHDDELLDGRSKDAIKTKARRLGLTADQAPRWSDEEDDLLREHYEEGGMDATIEALQQAGYERTKLAIQKRANETLGLHVRSMGFNRWDYDADQDVVTLWLRRQDGSEVPSYVDADDLDLLLAPEKRWCLWASGGHRYAYMQIDGETTLMHRYLLEHQLTDDEPHIDHIDGDGLNNRRSNLQIIRPGTNQSRVWRRRSNSKYDLPRGVTLNRKCSDDRRYAAQVGWGVSKGGCTRVGSYPSPQKAVWAYIVARLVRHWDNRDTLVTEPKVEPQQSVRAVLVLTRKAREAFGWSKDEATRRIEAAIRYYNEEDEA